MELHQNHQLQILVLDPTHLNHDLPFLNLDEFFGHIPTDLYQQLNVLVHGNSELILERELLCLCLHHGLWQYQPPKHKACKELQERQKYPHRNYFYQGAVHLFFLRIHHFVRLE